MPSEVDLSRVNTYPFAERRRKVHLSDFACPCSPSASICELFRTLPHLLRSKDLLYLTKAIVHAKVAGKPVLLMMGAHVIKAGLSRVVVDLLNRGVVSAVATNGAGAIHDFEISMWGETSEEVTDGLEDGSFGMAEETGSLINQAIDRGMREGWGFGESIARHIKKLQAPHREESIFYVANQRNVPVTVHVALGTDVVHQHASANGAAVGETSLRDFRILIAIVSELGDGGVVLNVGSAVILPEVFMKALNVARNLGHSVKDFTTADFDMIQHYRPGENVVHRPVLSGGKGFSFIGHHEIMIPLLALGVKAAMEGQDA